MATIPCEQCSKTFRAETGFAWHSAHLHQLEQDIDSVDSSSALERDDDIRSLSSRIDELEEAVGFVSDAGSRIEAVQNSLGLGEDSTETVAELITDLGGWLERLESEVSPLNRLPQILEGAKTRASEQEQAMAQVREVFLALSSLLWELDREHKAKNNFADIALDVSPEDRERARQVIRYVLSSTVRVRPQATCMLHLSCEWANLRGGREGRVVGNWVSRQCVSGLRRRTV